MENKYILERINLIKENNTLNYAIYRLTTFLNKIGPYFHKPESIEALKNIHTYLIEIQEKKKHIEQHLLENEENIKATCSHDILVKNQYNLFVCPICRKKWKVDEIDFDCILVENNSYLNIANIIYEICAKEESIIDTFENYIEQENVRIYRRTK